MFLRRLTKFFLWILHASPLVKMMPNLGSWMRDTTSSTGRLFTFLAKMFCRRQGVGKLKGQDRESIKFRHDIEHKHKFPFS